MLTDYTPIFAYLHLNTYPIRLPTSFSRNTQLVTRVTIRMLGPLALLSVLSGVYTQRMSTKTNKKTDVYWLIKILAVLLVLLIFKSAIDKIEELINIVKGTMRNHLCWFSQAFAHKQKLSLHRYSMPRTAKSE